MFNITTPEQMQDLHSVEPIISKIEQKLNSSKKNLKVYSISIDDDLTTTESDLIRTLYTEAGWEVTIRTFDHQLESGTTITLRSNHTLSI